MSYGIYSISMSVIQIGDKALEIVDRSFPVRCTVSSGVFSRKQLSGRSLSLISAFSNRTSTVIVAKNKHNKHGISNHDNIAPNQVISS